MSAISQQQTSQFPHKLTRMQWAILVLVLLLVVIDFIIGPSIQFPMFFILPVMLAAWTSGVVWAFWLAVVLAAARFVCHYWFWEFPDDMIPVVVNIFMRFAILLVVAYATARVAKLVRDLRQRVDQLERLLPVCRSCGLIRQEDGTWVPVNTLPQALGESKTVCPGCQEKKYGAYS